MKEPKLWQKGLILVSVPLLFELGIVASLDSLLVAAENEARLAEQSRDIVKEASLVAKITYDCVNALYWCTRHPDDKAWFDKYDLASQEIVRHLKNLARLVKNRSPREKKIVLAFEKGTLQQFKLMSTIRRFISAGTNFSDSDIAEHQGDFSQQLSVMAYQLEELTKVVAPEQYLAREQASRERLRTGLYAGLLVNIGVALALASYFSKGTISRLRILMDNTQRLSKRQSLSEPIKGNDEIAELDHVFHKMAARLAEVERLKQNFVSMISHDLRSPLTSLKGLLFLIKKGSYGELNKSGIARVEGAEGNLTRLISLINDLLDVDKLESEGFELFKSRTTAQALVKAAFDSVQTLAESKEITLLSIGSLDETLYVDTERFVQILVNLLSNAIKFSDQNSKVEVETQKKENFIEISVKDYGRGIPEDKLELIFDRFKQVEKTDASEKGGTGLGLAICKALVKAHGATITVESQPGEGSRFIISLPLEPSN